MIFGIQARGSVRLSEVGRALGEEIAPKKTEERLCQQLGRPWLEEAISRRIIHLAAPRIHEDTLLMLDISDVSKKYAQKMEYLARVRDGSEEALILVVVKGFGDEPLMMLTDLEVRLSRKSLWQVISYYLLRWRIEELIRFHKQSYNLENIRLLTYTRLQNMMALVTAAACALRCIWA